MINIRELTEVLTKASVAYYNGTPTMEDHEYDALEREYQGLTGKPFAIIENAKGEKFRHEWAGKSLRALSLDKTKDTALIVKKFSEFKNLGGNSEKAVVMWKLDGSTLQLYYRRNPKSGTLDLVHAVTRGTSGEEGVIVTHNALFINGIPQHITSDAQAMVVRGEALMSYIEFERINKESKEEDEFANPRNLATSTVGMDDPKEGVMKRRIDFKAFNLVLKEDVNGTDQRSQTFDGRLKQLDDMGFNVVEHKLVDISSLEATMSEFESDAENYDYPVDGEVISYNDIVWAESQPGTEHNPHISVGYALKWADEEVATKLIDIEWNTTRTGKINPVAIFEPVQIEGTTVERATLHNLSEIQKKLGNPYIGEKIWVYKANKIIPAIARWEYEKSQNELASLTTPKTCPCCNKEAVVETSALGVKTLYCSNTNCPAKKVDAITNFASKTGLNIEGLSEERIQFLIEKGIISDAKDLFTLTEESLSKALEDEKGWGEKSIKNLIDAINKSRDTDFVSFISAMGINGIGRGQAKAIKKHLEKIYTDYEEEFELTGHDGSYDLMGMMVWLNQEKSYDWSIIDGFKVAVPKALSEWINNNFEYDTNELSDVEAILKELKFNDGRPSIDESSATLDGLTFVITGSLNNFSNRDALKTIIENHGGKVAGSVSKNTAALINNDLESTSGKNKKAKELGVEIISEDEFILRYNISTN